MYFSNTVVFKSILPTLARAICVVTNEWNLRSLEAVNQSSLHFTLTCLIGGISILSGSEYNQQTSHTTSLTGKFERANFLPLRREPIQLFFKHANEQHRLGGSQFLVHARS